MCICGRDALPGGAIQTTSCQHCSNYVIVQRHFLNTCASVSDANIHSQIPRNDTVSERQGDQLVSNDVTVHFDSAKGIVSSLVSTDVDVAEHEPMISDENVSKFV
jgi:hypothetical protein